MALLAAGWKPDPDLKHNPLKDQDKYLENDIMPRINQFSKKRQMETLIAIKESWDDVPDKIKEIYNKVDMNILEETNIYKTNLEKISIRIEDEK